ncbi:MAG: YggT family protein [Clostridia bacterium]|nr:YggT family protein [Clostridia bacterium]
MIDYVVYIVETLPIVFLVALQFAMMGRAIGSWFLQDDSPLYNFLVEFTEPVIAPVAAVFEALGWFQDSVIDMPFLATMMIVAMLESALTLFR